MKRQLMEILACPLCKGTLELQVAKEEGNEIVAGSLKCTSCKQSYTISDGIPNLLPPESRGG